MGKAAEAAVALEEAFLRNVPLRSKKPIREADMAAALQKFNGEAKEIRSKYSLGVLGRASAAYRLQQRLIALGYPAEAVRQVVFSLVLSAFVGKE